MYNIYLIKFNTINLDKGEEIENENNVRKSRQWNIPLTTLPEEVYSFETHVYGNEVIVIILTNIDEPEIRYEIEYNLDEIKKVFQVLPKSVKDELHTLIDYQVFISGLVNKNKIELFLAKFNRMKIEFIDIAKAPKGAMYNTTIMVSKYEPSYD